MSFLVTTPAVLRRAAEGVEAVRDRTVEINRVGVPVLAAVVAPAGDVVSQKAANYLKSHAKEYEKTIARAVAVLGRFSGALSASAEAYSTTEVDNRATLS